MFNPFQYFCTTPAEWPLADHSLKSFAVNDTVYNAKPTEPRETGHIINDKKLIKGRASRHRELGWSRVSQRKTIPPVSLLYNVITTFFFTLVIS